MRLPVIRHSVRDLMAVILSVSVACAPFVWEKRKRECLASASYFAAQYKATAVLTGPRRPRGIPRLSENNSRLMESQLQSLVLEGPLAERRRNDADQRDRELLLGLMRSQVEQCGFRIAAMEDAELTHKQDLAAYYARLSRHYELMAYCPWMIVLPKPPPP